MSKTPEEISDALLKPFPPEVIEDKQGKRYIGHELIRMRVIEATGNIFDWTVDSTEYREDGAIKGRADKTSGEIRTPLVSVVRGTLTIPGLGSRTGVGVQVIEFGAGEDAPYKGAESDAFKRAAMAFGCALHLYMNTPSPSRPEPRQNAPQATTAPLMSPGQLETAFAAALTNQNGTEVTRLIAGAGASEPHWIALVKGTADITKLNWVIKKSRDAGHEFGNQFDQAVATKRDAING